SMSYLIELTLEHCSTDSFKSLWLYLNLESASLKHSASGASRVIIAINQIVQFKKSKFVYDASHLLCSLVDCLSRLEFDSENKQKIFSVLRQLLLFKFDQLSTDKVNYLCQHFYSSNSECKLSLNEKLNFLK